MVFSYHISVLHSPDKHCKRGCGISKGPHLVELRGHLFKDRVAVRVQVQWLHVRLDVVVLIHASCLLHLALGNRVERLVLWGFFLRHL